MAAHSTPSRLRRSSIGFLALVGGFIIVTSGPLSVQGYAASGPSSDASNDSGSSAVFDDPPEVLWDILQQLDYTTGEVGEDLQQFVGKEVKVPGFVVPLEDFASEVTEFLLVPYVGACVHTPPPPPNQLVFVQMEGDKTITALTWDPFWIHGTLVIEETENMYGSVGFKISGTEIQPYEW